MLRLGAFDPRTGAGPAGRAAPRLRPAHLPAGRRGSSRWATWAICFGEPVRRRGGGAGAPRRAAERGADLEVEVTISFDESLHGAEVRMPVEQAGRLRDLPRQRRQAGHHAQDLPRMPGTRRDRQNQGFFALSQPCPRCHGNGTIIEKPCPTCHGTGMVRQTKRYTVKIPAGVKDGTRIRIKGKRRGRYARRPAGRPVRGHAGRLERHLPAPRRRPR